MPPPIKRLRPWNMRPTDQVLSASTHDFLAWVQTSINSSIGNTTPLPAPTVKTGTMTKGVIISWNELSPSHNGIAGYQIYEMPTNAIPGAINVPVGSVLPNVGGTSNSFTRQVSDTTTRYYFVRAFTNGGVPGNFSLGVPGAGS